MNNLCTLPKNMSPSQTAFEKLGFSFIGSSDSKMYQVTLPMGWKFELSNPIGLINIVDQTGHSRVAYDYKQTCMSIL